MLYVVATPIGNLSDMSPRAIETLKSVSLIAAEDTRVTMKLASKFDIHTPMTSCHRHNEQGKAEQIVSRMQEEQIDVALVTDAGTPGISDPGTHLVHLCAQAGIPVVAVPGACAMACAVSVSGFDFTEFTFFGFLPREKKDLREKLRSMVGLQGAVIHESPFRIIDLMEAVCETLPGAMVSASCDLTKLHELTIRGTPEKVLDALKSNEKSEKGEYCVVLDLRAVQKEESPIVSESSLEARLFEQMLDGTDLHEAMSRLTESGEKKKAVYAASLRIKEFLSSLQNEEESP